MHEEAYVTAIVEEAKKQGEVYEILLEVGELAKISPRDLQKAIAAKTPWRVLIMNKESKVACLCGYNGKAKVMDRGHDYVLYACPQCHGQPAVLDGDKVILKQVKVR